LINCMISFCSFSIADNWRSSSRQPPFYAFRDDTAFPSAVLAPVELSHGFQF